MQTWQKVTIDQLVARGSYAAYKWHRQNGEVWDCVALANGGIMGNPGRVMLGSVIDATGTARPGVWSAWHTRLEIPTQSER